MDFGVYSLVDVLVCKDSENRAKCKINCDLFSFLTPKGMRMFTLGALIITNNNPEGFRFANHAKHHLEEGFWNDDLVGYLVK